ncbi:extracellular solute-binding protein [Halomarina halobia]|uniref:Extracellular solute-binding protein n=1 Tax=Halomarina halobia TaxID=3033386 RepID=A0ABD6AE89_9EURY|nr:extracellular solute-binding protein [Halomarina sp. PSR21]
MGIAGCLGGGGDSGNLNVDDGSGNNSSSGGSDLPSKSEAVGEWGTRINEHAREAGIDWGQFEGTSLTFGMNVHPFTEVTKPLLPYFKELTGIDVTFNTYPEDQLWQKLTLDLNSKNGKYDGFFLGLWPSARYHNAGWVRNLTRYIDDSSITDKSWLHLEDYPESALKAFTYQGEQIAMPFGVEAYGCVAYDEPTFEKLGIGEPTTLTELRDAAKTIHESEEVNRSGICSRASSTTLSSANWATMFKSFGANWIDRDNRKAMLNSEQGIASLELFAEMMGEYGPSDIGTFDWYKANQAFGNGQVGIAYHTPSAVGTFTRQQYRRTKWLPPLPGPDGDVVADTWEWALGVSQYSENPKAAWLFLQWATSRPAILLQNTAQWQDQPTYGPARSNWLFEQKGFNESNKESWRTAHSEGMDAVPSSPPPVPLDTPQNMDIMSRAAIAMNAAVTGTKSAERALDDAAPDITKIAEKIPDAYISQ